MYKLEKWFDKKHCRDPTLYISYFKLCCTALYYAYFFSHFLIHWFCQCDLRNFNWKSLAWYHAISLLLLQQSFGMHSSKTHCFVAAVNGNFPTSSDKNMRFVTDAWLISPITKKWHVIGETFHMKFWMLHW